MSFLDSILDVGSSVLKWATGNSTSAGIARTAALSYALKQVNDSIARDNKQNEKTGSNSIVSLNPSTESNIPVLYGKGFLSGTITDAQSTNNNLTMWFCVTLCEKTGPLLSTGEPSQLKFVNMYWNDFRVVFRADGVTASYLIDDDGNVSTDIDGLVRVYPFSGNSSSPTKFVDYVEGNTIDARELFTNWTADHTMSDLNFALIRVDYNTSKGITGIGKLDFQLENTLTEPGDVLYDYMTATTYGCGLSPEDLLGE